MSREFKRFDFVENVIRNSNCLSQSPKMFIISNSQVQMIYLMPDTVEILLTDVQIPVSLLISIYALLFCFHCGYEWVQSIFVGIKNVEKHLERYSLPNAS